MNFQRDFVPLLLGLLLGGSLGVLVTDNTRELLRRTRYLAPERGSTPNRWPWVNRFIFKISSWSRKLHISGWSWKLYLIVGLFNVWLVLISLFASGFDRSRYAVIGSIVGFTAAPWVWLHFARDFLTDDERKGKEADNVLNEYLSRYRLLTIVLGVILLFVMFGDRLFHYFDRANKIDFFGLSVAVSGQAGGPSVTPLIAPSTSPANSAIEKLSQNTHYARQIWNGKTHKGKPDSTIENVASGLKEFDDLSIWDRDRSFISYFIYSDSHRHQLWHPKPPKDLFLYVNGAMARNPDVERDMRFLKNTSAVFACLDNYAQKIGDIHLYFLDTSNFLKELSLVTNKSEEIQWQNASAPGPLTKMMTAIENLVSTIRLVGDVPECGPLQPWDMVCCDLRPPGGATPYPILLAAFSLAAVESPETGILYIANWLRNQKPAEATAFARRWYILRAEIELRSMATQYIRPRMETERLLFFQRSLSNDFRSLLHVEPPDGWKKLCSGFEKGQLHSEIGRRLGFQYAVARNYLFELQTPAIIQLAQTHRPNETLPELRKDIEEATELAASEECFTGVPLFHGEKDQNRRKWLAQFQLNLIQLRVAQAAIQGHSLSESELEREKEDLTRMLDSAKDGLGPINDNRNEARRDDQLLKSDSFDDQRGRVSFLTSLVSSLRKPE